MKKILLICLGLILCINLSEAQNSKRNKKSKKKNADVVETPAKEVIPTVETLNSYSKEIEEEQLLQISKPYVQQETHGHIDWTNQYIEAKGEALIDTSRFKNYGQARAMAIRGAQVVAQRNLLEIIKGVHVVGETTVQDMITINDAVQTRVEGVIRGAQAVGEPVEKFGMMEVTMRVWIYDNSGLAPVVHKSAQAAGKDNIIVPTSSEYTPTPAEDKPFVFNLNGKNYDPAMFPVVVDENGKVLLDMSTLYDPKSGKFPKIFNTTRDVFELAGFDKGVEIVDIARTEPGKLVVADTSKSKVNWSKIGSTAAKIGKFLLMLL
ncbi:MAG: LPP20 family lipoprotein [Cytophagaceae bacterium]